jgi:hypothetical protein
VTQQSLIVDEPGGLAVAEQHSPSPANDLRHAMMTLPVEQQTALLTEYKARRDNFRDWLMSQLIEGTHFGIVPGCEPKKKEINGVTNYGVWNKKKSEFDWHPATQWTPKPSLYAAGADFLCDILGVRDEYETDAVAWQQMGSKPGNAVVKCRLVSRATGELIGESLGAYYHQYDPNNALKMASKCAKVGAVINAYDLRDLFTQDVDPTPNINPEADRNAPSEQPRSKRPPKQQVVTDVSQQQLGHVTAQWRATHPDPNGDAGAQRVKFYAWAKATCGRDFDPSKLVAWTLDDYQGCCAALNIPTLEDLA